jgi:predicted membrane protein
MNNDIGHPNNPRNGKAIAGIILLVVGGVLLLQQFNFLFIPDGLVLWPLWLIGWGLFIASRSNFSKPSSFILVAIGVVFLIDKNFHGADHIVWPMLLIGFGLWMILRRRGQMGNHWGKHYEGNWDRNNQKSQNPNEPVVDYTTSSVPPQNSSGFPPSGDDYLDAVSVFGNVKKTILSKDFKGGEIVNIFGGAELNFTQADINGRVIIDITQLFGGTKIIVPPHWQVVSDIAAVFAGIDDKRMKMTAPANSDKILVLKGVSIFAGVDVRSY